MTLQYSCKATSHRLTIFHQTERVDLKIYLCSSQGNKPNILITIAQIKVDFRLLLVGDLSEAAKQDAENNDQVP